MAATQADGDRRPTSLDLTDRDTGLTSEPAPYQSYYGFHKRPFSLTANQDCFYLSPSHLAALDRLKEAMQNPPHLAVLTGETGTGKSSLVQKLLHDAKNGHRILYSTNTDFNAPDLRNWLSSELQLAVDNDSGAADFYRDLQQKIQDLQQQGQAIVLLLDEAQQLADDALRELAALCSALAADQLPLVILLVGQNNLSANLRRISLEIGGTPVSVSAHLDTLDAEETEAYIRYRNRSCGGNEDLFTSSACNEVFRQSGGIARVINLVCDAALVYGFAELSPIINAALVKAVKKDGQAEEGEGDLGVWIGNQAEFLNELENVENLLGQDPEDSQEMAAVSPVWDEPVIDGSEVARYTRLFFEGDNRSEEPPHSSTPKPVNLQPPPPPVPTAGPKAAVTPVTQPEPMAATDPGQAPVAPIPAAAADPAPSARRNWGQILDSISLVLAGVILVIVFSQWERLPFREHTGDLSATILQAIADTQQKR